ncbi:heme peroxidase [Lentinula detonsa]|uniref:Peroxidase n=1 Tax=Lentinula detonsa TaxID=2804962 RepID=A0A9W8NYR7_9AGAR|nr:heme peroxidase [Lentinula detonsa]
MFRSLCLLRISVTITLILADYARSFSTFQWPNPQLAYADKQLYEGSLGLLAQNCPPRENTTIPAQWLRIAYHDMSTHNVDDGTGGLDASIQYELDRPQNIGQGQLDSLNDFKAFNIIAPFFGSKYFTNSSGKKRGLLIAFPLVADIIALGAVFAVAGCGGPLIPLSAGRVDATEAGPATVPEPQQDLASHTEAFRRQGFTPTEMIGLVACGHTLGGVRQVDFPLVVTDAEDVLQTFDTTTNFDNAVVSEYLQNTTENILVVGPNVTTRSDFRIFSSDGNVTMQSFLSSDLFNETCGTLIGRMINTVPSGVTLTQPISEPFDYVVSEPLFSYRSGTFSVVTTLRVLGDNPDRTVTMLWADRQGSNCPTTGCTSPSTQTDEAFLTFIGNIQGLTVNRFLFNATINATTSISKFWFEVDEKDGSDPILVNNGGSGFVIEQDSLFIDNGRSEAVLVTFPTLEQYKQVVVAIRGDSSSSVSITTFDPVSNATTPPYLPTIITTNLQLDERNPSEGGFTFFTANVTDSVNFINITGNVGGTSYTQENFDMTVAAFPFVEISQ